MKNRIINELKFFLLVTMMTLGFFYCFTIIWVTVGLPMTWWALLINCALSALSEIAYINWVRDT